MGSIVSKYGAIKREVKAEDVALVWDIQMGELLTSK